MVLEGIFSRSMYRRVTKIERNTWMGWFQDLLLLLGSLQSCRQPPAFIFQALSTRLIFLSQTSSIIFQKTYCSISLATIWVYLVLTCLACATFSFQHPHMDLTMGSYRFCARQVQPSSSNFKVWNCKCVLLDSFTCVTFPDKVKIFTCTTAFRADPLRY